MQKFYATLVRGSSYTLGGVKFDNGVAKVVSEETKDTLAAKAIDEVSATNGEVFTKDKFEFAPVESDDEDAAEEGEGAETAAAPSGRRTRSRS